VKELLPDIVKKERTCHCKSLMERYRKKGKIGKNWREWILDLNS